MNAELTRVYFIMRSLGFKPARSWDYAMSYVGESTQNAARSMSMLRSLFLTL